MKNSSYIPTTIIDGFLDHPEALRDFALKQEYTPGRDGRWPGKRSKPLYELSPIVYETYIRKILSIFFNTNEHYTYNTDTTFQIVDKEYESGWIHRDDCILTAILYLTPGSVSGTSLYERKDILFDDRTYQDEKLKSYLAGNGKDCGTARELHNQNFESTLDVKGIFNRLLLFNSLTYHGAHDFFGDNNNDSRLTLVTFFNGITGSFITPLQRSRNIIGPTIL